MLNPGSGFGGPRSVAVDGSGNLYVADFDHQAITKLDLTDGPALAFADTAVGATSAAQSAPVLNNGNAPLFVAALVTTSLNFLVDATTTTCSTGSPVATGAGRALGRPLP